MKSYIFIQENLKMSSDSKVHGANMGPSGADMTQVGPMNFAIWVVRKMAAILC